MLKHTGGSKCCPHYSNPTMHAVLSHFKTENKSISVKQFNMVRGYCKRIQYFRMVCERCFVGEGPMGKGILVTCNGIIERPESQMIVKVDRTCKSRVFFFFGMDCTTNKVLGLFICWILTKREELLLRTVLAFP